MKEKNKPKREDRFVNDLIAIRVEASRLELSKTRDKLDEALREVAVEVAATKVGRIKWG